tara:strand:+ start:116 stop:499 length:384 start_codon:yes stop_codon:yes gene_type:complete
MPYTEYKTHKTEKFKLSSLYDTFGSRSLSSESASDIRNVRRRRFLGGVAYNRIAPSSTITLILEVTDGTTSYQIDRVTITPGTSHVWNANEFGVDLANDQYISITATKSFGLNDSIYVFMRFQDMYS